MEMMKYTLASLTLLLLPCMINAIYVDYGDPYKLGEFNTTLKFFSNVSPINPPPIHTTGEYAVLYFVTGFGGVMPPYIYHDLLLMLASHGYIIFAEWNLLGEDGPEIGIDVHYRQLEWLEENTADEMEGARGDFGYLSLGCHSSGCGATLKMMVNESDTGLAMANVEPNAFAIAIQDIDFSVPTLNYGTELANLTCTTPGLDFEAWQKKTLCPKIMMETANAGHCDLLDQESWEACEERGFCTVTDDSRIYEYKLVVQGILSSFLTGYVQGNPDQLNYITEEDNIPWDLNQHEVDIEC